MVTCSNGLPAPEGCAYCATPTAGPCQVCWDAAHPYTLCPPPFAYVISVGWGAVVDGEYLRLYCRHVTPAELWPITGAMAQSPLTIAQIDALIVAQSGQPTCLVTAPAPPSGSPPTSQPAPTPTPTPPGAAPGQPTPTPITPTPPGSTTSPPGQPFPSTGTGSNPGVGGPAGRTGTGTSTGTGGFDWRAILADANKNGALLAVVGLGLAGLLLGGGGGRRR